MILDLSDIPNFCAHEHWGSLASIGHSPAGFRADLEPGALPVRAARLLDLLTDPYQAGWAGAEGIDLGHGVGAVLHTAEPLDTVAAEHPVRAVRALLELLDSQRLTGVYQCTRRGIHLLYDVDLEEEADDTRLQDLDHRVESHYRELFAWYPRAMAKAGFTELIRPVHPEFYLEPPANPGAADAERRFTHTIMRIDPLLELWPRTCPRRERLAERVGVEPADCPSWRRFLDRVFECAAEAGTTGIKQLQAYTRHLDFQPRSEAGLRFTGDLDLDQRIAVQDWIVHECCQRAHELGWPHQVHVGTHNLPASNPLPLMALAQRYPRMKIVMLHCWPFLRESAYLMKQVPNVYADTCWQNVLSPAFLREALVEWLTFVPRSKVMLSHDSTSVEMAAGSSLFTRETLCEVLADTQHRLGLRDARALRATAVDLLQNNAVRVYGIGDPA